MNQSLEGAMARWRRLEAYLDRLDRSRLSRLSRDELDEFVHLYRTACADLARARSDNPGHNIENYLNDIVARGHKQFRPPSAPGSGKLFGFFRTDFPVAVRRMGWHLVAAALLFVVPMVAAAAIVYTNPTTAYTLASPEMLDAMAEAYEKGHAAGRSEGEDSLMTGYYIRHNTGIAFQCFATGIFFAIGSVFALLFNGVVIGAVGGYVCASGHAENFLSFVAGHGSFELTAIVLSGATGIRMGMLLVNPGPWTRLAAFKVHAPEILRVVLGAAVMLFIAALIEGFWSPSSAPPGTKYLVGGVLWLAVLSYLGLAGRGRET